MCEKDTTDSRNTSEACGCSPQEGERKMGIFERLEHISQTLEDVGEENILNMLNEAVAEWEAEDKAAEEKKSE